MQSVNNIMKGRIRWYAILTIAFFCYLIGRLYWVQIHLHDTLYEEARAKYVTSKEVKGTRGQVFDKMGNLLIGNFGDGAVYKVVMDEDGKVISNEIWAQDKEHLESTDGMIMDEDGNLYIADFCANAIVKVSPDGKTVKRLAQSPDSDGLGGELDQPGEPIIWNGKLVVSCFDVVTNDIVVNTAHELPATLAEIEF